MISLLRVALKVGLHVAHKLWIARPSVVKVARVPEATPLGVVAEAERRSAPPSATTLSAPFSIGALVGLVVPLLVNLGSDQVDHRILVL
jgi:hypothetical protein